jgi:integrase
MWLRKAPKFKTLAQQVLELKRTRAPGTYALAEHYLKRLTEHFGEMRVSGITEIEWGTYVAQCKARQPKRKLHDDKKFMSQVMRTALREEHLRRPILLQIPDGKSEAGREITPDELAKLFAVARPLLALQMEFALKTGFRLREMLHLRWDRFRWKEEAIRLRPEDTKTRKGRLVPLEPILFAKLHSRFAETRSPYVFPSRFDPKAPQDDNKTAWRNLKTKTLVTCRWHDFRHTCATQLLRRGISTSVVRKYLGMTEAVLTGIYQHLNLDDLRAAALAMSDMWRGPK